MLDGLVCFIMGGSHAAVCAIRAGMALGGSLGLPGAVSPQAAPAPAPVVETAQGCLTEPPAPERCGARGIRWRCEDGILKWEDDGCTFEERMIAMEQRRDRPLPADWPEDE